MNESLNTAFDVACMCTAFTVFSYACIILINTFIPHMMLNVCDKRKPTACFRLFHVIALIAFCITFFVVCISTLQLNMVDIASEEAVEALLHNTSFVLGTLVSPIGVMCSIKCMLFADNGIKGKYAQNFKF
jgi:hypothetical protein